MTQLRPLRVAREHPIAIAVVAGVIAVQVAWMVGAAVCPRMTMTECVVAAVVLVAGASVLSIVVRVAWLAATTARALAALPRAPMPQSLQTAAQRAGIPRLHSLAGTDRTAFCAGLIRPSVYITAATAQLKTNEVDAVLAHEAAHARRRDPLRRLVTRAAADVMFWLPLLRWWLHKHVENAEVHADKAAIDHAGRQGLAAALLAAGAQPPVPMPAMAGATETRIAHLLGEDLPIRRPPASLVVLSLLGAIGAVWIVMCLGQGALAAIGW
ncbi:M56 family metallopeptidase [Mycobacterium hubeiense]|uniref:M56 family metallopeptidase n=1 Tax=Mycobacterium hubeiense TaxID=1867256 RepID=UPI000C7F01E4|nr:M56 family metallopeptidase [Mycobacterium sp. QGD 101]